MDHSRFDLDFMRDFCGGDEQKMNYYLEKFEKQYPLEMERLLMALEAEDRDTIAKVAHGFRPQLDFVGLKEDAALVFELEHHARNNRSFEELRNIFNRLNSWEY